MRGSTRLKVNGRPQALEIDARAVLADVLREQCSLTSVHIGCRTGHCGACTVILDGALVKSCCVLGMDANEGEVETVESLSQSAEQLHPIQEAFVECHGLQCGYCTPGMILSARALLAENSAPSEEEIRRAMAGNLCRCTGYQNIIRSVLLAAEQIRHSAIAGHR